MTSFGPNSACSDWFKFLTEPVCPWFLYLKRLYTYSGISECSYQKY